MVHTTFADTSLGKNVKKLNQCHTRIDEFYDEMTSSIQRMEEKIKVQTNISMIIQDGVRLMKENLKKLEAVKCIQVREVNAIETELNQ